MPRPSRLASSAARALFSADQWRKLEANPAGRVDEAEWARFTPAQREAVRALRRELRSDGTARAARPLDVDRLQGGPGGTPWAGRNAKIHDIQGPGARSPLEGQPVATRGIVTAVDERGFYLMEPNTGIERGSPGLFVFTEGRPNVKPGDEVFVGGKVVEYQKPTEREEFPESSTTQLFADLATLQVKSSGNPLPELVIGKGGVELSATESNHALWERLEGARVRINDPVVTGPPNQIPRFSDAAVLPDGGPTEHERTRAGGLQRGAGSASKVVQVRLPTAQLPPLNVGARLPRGLVGNVVERRGKHQVQVWEPGAEADVIPSAIQPKVSTLRARFPDSTHVLFVGSLNAENLDVKVEDLAKVANQDVRNVDDDVGDGKLARLAEQIVKNLGAPDVVAMQEIQDNDGAEVSDVTDASETWRALIEKIVELGGPRYAWVDRPPQNGAEGGMPGGNIRNGFLYDASRVKLDEPSVNRLEDPAFDGSRRPLQAAFLFEHGGQTERVTLVSVHNKSKRGGSGTELAREAQSLALNRWAKEHAPAHGHAHLGVLGDRNAYFGEAPLNLETQDGALVLLDEQLPAAERYTSQFGGVSGALDHVSVKTSVPVALDAVHMNSDFDQRVRASDHDGLATAWDFRRGQG